MGGLDGAGLGLVESRVCFGCVGRAIHTPDGMRRGRKLAWVATDLKMASRESGVGQSASRISLSLEDATNSLWQNCPY